MFSIGLSVGLIIFDSELIPFVGPLECISMIKLLSSFALDRALLISRSPFKKPKALPLPSPETSVLSLN